MKRAAVLFGFILIALVAGGAGQSPTPTRIRVGSVHLTYVERGTGEPVILLHGGQADYRSWEPHVGVLAQKYRVIAYSRRYNYPNENPIDPKDHSAYVEAEDLAGFIRKLGLRRVHLVGTSMGAFTALIYAVKHPGNVASLSLAEPAIHAWVLETSAYKDFMSKAWFPAAEAFRKGDDRGAMRILVDAFGGEGKFDKLPAEAAAVAMQNARFFRAATLSADHSPDLPKDKVRRLTMPVLIIRGENTFSMPRLITEELERVLPNAERAVIPKAGHGSPRENPQAFTDAVIRFLAGVTRR